MKANIETIENFFSSSAYAVVGVSEDKKKFGNIVYNTMKQKKFTVYPVNPKLSIIEGDTCYTSLRDLPEDVKSVVTVVPPQVVSSIIKDCVQKKIAAVWMQPGSESEEAISYALQNNITVVSGECILMFLEPVESFHAIHRWIKKLFGLYPK
jgi:uncharacterized protein